MSRGDDRGARGGLPVTRAGLPVVLAVGLDALAGEPPVRWHPVVWTGRYLDAVAPLVPSRPRARAMLTGGALWAVGAAGAGVAGCATGRLARRLPGWADVLLTATALWPLLSARLLLREVDAVEQALATDLPTGRRVLARIVSRDTSALTEAEVRASALESLAENLADSVVAPLAWYAAGGLPAAAGYRFVNTADALWGYRCPRWRHAGTVAARADDLLNLLPARLTGVLLLYGPGPGGPPAAVLRRLTAEARRTPSPNGGWPMGALALRLGLRLPKPGSYCLNPGGRDPDPGDTAAALRLARAATVAAVALTAVAATLRGHHERSRRAVLRQTPPTPRARRTGR